MVVGIAGDFGDNDVEDLVRTKDIIGEFIYRVLRKPHAT